MGAGVVEGFDAPLAVADDEDIVAPRALEFACIRPAYSVILFTIIKT